MARGLAGQLVECRAKAPQLKCCSVTVSLASP